MTFKRSETRLTYLSKFFSVAQGGVYPLLVRTVLARLLLLSNDFVSLHSATLKNTLHWCQPKESTECYLIADLITDAIMAHTKTGG